MIYVFLGTKAQLIKMAPIMRKMQDQHIPYAFIFSGQHQATIGDLLDNFGVKKPDFTLYTGDDITSIGKMLVWSTRVLWKGFKQRHSIFPEGQHIILNHGDTFSTFIGSLLGKLVGAKTAHIESGLTSHNIFHPFPEELTRRIVFRLSDYYFCPGSWAVDNLKSYRGEKINTTNNTLLDALEYCRETDSGNITIPNESYCVATLHRFENIFKKQRFDEILLIVEAIANTKKVLFILHKPTLNKLQSFNFYDRLSNNPNIELRPRYNYFDFIDLVKSSEFVISDGGSNQEECYYLGKPCLLMRRHTERQEGIGGNAMISNYNLETCISFSLNFKNYQRTPVSTNVHSPSQKIINNIKTFASVASNEN